MLVPHLAKSTHISVRGRTITEDLSITWTFTGQIQAAKIPTGSTVSTSSFAVTPASAAAGTGLIWAGIGSTNKFLVQPEGIRVASGLKVFMRSVGDDDVFLWSNADGEATLQADSKVTVDGLTQTVIGHDGDIELGSATERAMKPLTDLKVNLGSATKRFNEAYIHELVVQRSVANVTTPTPTIAQLDSAFGTVPEGFIGLLDDNGSGASVFLVVRSSSAWWIEALTKIVS
jgi:hypothetical protein